MSEVTTQAKPERRKRQKLEDMEGYKPSIYGLTRDELIDEYQSRIELGQRMLEYYAFEIKPIVDSIYALEDGVAAFKHMADGAQFGKIVVRTVA